jgi:hypothetical protein
MASTWGDSWGTSWGVSWDRVFVPPTPTPTAQAMGGLSSSRNKTYYIERDGKRIFFHNESEVSDLLNREEEKAVKKAKKSIKKLKKAELITFADLNIIPPKLVFKFNDGAMNKEVDRINERIHANYLKALMQHIELMEEDDLLIELLFH